MRRWKIQKKKENKQIITKKIEIRNNKKKYNSRDIKRRFLQDINNEDIKMESRKSKKERKIRERQ